ncbi:MAG: ketopantoate reductase family protein [Lachnospiraceae bacterium]|nr:ketopantoate reductase family protein [Lachnospiraceae bacterium]
MKREIKNVCIVGMGALGLLFGQMINENNKDGENFFLMDEDRRKRHENDVYRINGREVHFPVRVPEECEGKKADLLMIATKYDSLRDAIKLSQCVVCEDTVIVSLLNGINSEEIISETFDRRRIIDCVPIGMDAMRDGSSLKYTKTGKLQIGARYDDQKEGLALLEDFFEKVSLPFEVCDDIVHAMWNKFMINVGINQACMVYEASYSQVLGGETAFKDLMGAMREVTAVARKAGVNLTEDDLNADMEILKSLDPDGYPSMRQDAVAKRKTEVEMFAGEMIRLSKIYNVPVPVNEKFYQKIREMER